VRVGGSRRLFVACWWIGEREGPQRTCSCRVLVGGASNGTRMMRLLVVRVVCVQWCVGAKARPPPKPTQKQQRSDHRAIRPFPNPPAATVPPSPTCWCYSSPALPPLPSAVLSGRMCVFAVRSVRVKEGAAAATRTNTAACVVCKQGTSESRSDAMTN